MFIEKERWKIGERVVVSNVNDPELAELTFLGEEGVITNISFEELDSYYDEFGYDRPSNDFTPIYVRTEGNSFWANPSELTLVPVNDVIPSQLPNLI